MGFMNKIKTLVGVGEEDYYEEDGYIEEEPYEPRATSRSSRYGLDEDRNSESKDRMWEGNRPRTSSRSMPEIRRDENVISMRNATINELTRELDIVRIEPRTFDECPKLVNILRAKKPVIIILDKVETDVAKKIYDFLLGAIYALDGKVEKIANNIFIFMPKNIAVSDADGQEEHSFGSRESSLWK
jgi:cell division inhibitor SepF